MDDETFRRQFVQLPATPRTEKQFNQDKADGVQYCAAALLKIMFAEHAKGCYDEHCVTTKHIAYWDNVSRIELRTAMKALQTALDQVYRA